MSGTHETTWSGAIEQTKGDVVWADFGVAIAFYLPAIDSPPNTSSSTINMDIPLPVSLRPSTRQVFPTRIVISDGDEVDGEIVVNTDGTVEVSANEGFSTSGNNGFPTQGVSYIK